MCVIGYRVHQARHAETNEPIPDELLARLMAAQVSLFRLAIYQMVDFLVSNVVGLLVLFISRLVRVLGHK